MFQWHSSVSQLRKWLFCIWHSRPFSSFHSPCSFPLWRALCAYLLSALGELRQGKDSNWLINPGAGRRLIICETSKGLASLLTLSFTLWEESPGLKSDLRLYSWLCHLLLCDLDQVTASPWVSVTSFISTLGSKGGEGAKWPVVFSEGYVVLAPEGGTKSFWFWAGAMAWLKVWAFVGKGSQEARRNLIRIKSKLLTMPTRPYMIWMLPTPNSYPPSCLLMLLPY